MFANQARPGSGPNIPPGRIAGQQAIKQNQGQQNDKLSSVSKMTISQAITLITLRLGAVESKLMHPSMESGVTDPEFFQSIMTRLDDLEKDNSSNTGSSNSGADVTLLTQQMEVLKLSVMQIKNTKQLPTLFLETLPKMQILKNNISMEFYKYHASHSFNSLILLSKPTVQLA